MELPPGVTKPQTQCPDWNGIFWRLGGFKPVSSSTLKMCNSIFYAGNHIVSCMLPYGRSIKYLLIHDPVWYNNPEKVGHSGISLSIRMRKLRHKDQIWHWIKQPIVMLSTHFFLKIQKLSFNGNHLIIFIPSYLR